MKKRTIIWLIILVTLILLCIALSCLFRKSGNNTSGDPNDEPQVEEGKTLMELDHFNSVKVDNISSVLITRYTEGGDDYEEITDESEIAGIYNRLNSRKVGEKTEQACEDNTTVYIFNLVDDSTVSVEIECSWVVIGNERYLLK